MDILFFSPSANFLKKIIIFTFETRSEITSFTVSSIKSSIFEWYCCCGSENQSSISILNEHNAICHKSHLHKGTKTDRSELFKIIKGIKPWKWSTHKLLSFIQYPEKFPMYAFELSS